MGIKTRLAAGTASLALLAGGSLAVMGAGTATAATPSCWHFCADLFVQKLGPSWLLDNSGQHLTAGNQQMLWGASNNDPAEDYTYDSPGESMGAPFITLGKLAKEDPAAVPPALLPSFRNDYVIQIEASPFGQNSSMCVGTWPGQTAQAAFKVRLEPCGQPNTLWIADEAHKVPDFRSNLPGIGHFDFPLIAGETNSLSDPLVMNYPGNSFPNDNPHPWIVVQPESNYANGQVFNNQEIGGRLGPVS